MKMTSTSLWPGLLTFWRGSSRRVALRNFRPLAPLRGSRACRAPAEAVDPELDDYDPRTPEYVTTVSEQEPQRSGDLDRVSLCNPQPRHVLGQSAAR